MRLCALSALALLAVAILAIAEDPAALANPGTLRWEYRLFLINEPADPQALLAQLAAEAAAIDERRVAWFVLSGNRLHSNYPDKLAAGLIDRIREQYDFGGDEVMLIGLDGGVKLRLAETDVDRLYAAIDGMPMRRLERRPD